MAGVKFSRFLLADGLASVLYAGGFLFLGYLFSNQIQQIAATLAHVGGSLVSLIVGLGVIYIGFKYWQRRRILRKLRMARITAAELRRKQVAGEEVVIIDLRPGEDLALDPSLIPGAVHFGMEEIEHRHQEIPRDREVIVYCSCPNEVSSARVALSLHRKGVTRVRPLLGGIDAWRELNYPLEVASLPPKAITPIHRSAAAQDKSGSGADLTKAA